MTTEFRLGEWLVQPQLNLLALGENAIRVEPKVMDVLVYLAENAGEVLPKERIIRAVWADAFVGDEALTYSISELRKALSDDARSPRFVQTIPRRGYRLIAPVSFLEKEPVQNQAHHQPVARSMTPLFVSLAVVVLAFVALLLWRGPSTSSDDPAPELVRFHERPPGVTFGFVDILALSPDDKHLAFTGIKDGKRRLWIRPLDSFSAYSLDDTENATHPFWSPDGREIGFFADHQLKAIDIANGIVRVVSKIDGWSGSWSKEGQILTRVFTSREPGLWVVPASGGEPQILKLHQAGLTDAGSSPRFLPDGNRFLFFEGDLSIWLSDLSSRKARVLINNSTGGVPIGPDLVVFARDNLLLAQTFDTTSGQLTGSAFTIADGLMPRRWHNSYFDATGEYLAYRVETSRQEQLVWLDREGRRLSTLGEAASYVQISLSPDQKKVAATLDPGTFETDIHLIDLRTEVTSRLTDRQDYDADPVWGPDSDRIAYSTGLGGSVRLLKIGRARDEHLFTLDRPEDRPSLETKAEDWSSDGKTLLVRGPANRVFQVSLDNMSSRLWLDSEGLVDQCKFSPNGRWIACSSNESGSWEVYVASFPEFGRKQQVSKGGGVQPRWRSDGRELFYLSQDGQMMSVPVTDSNDGLRLDPPEPLFQSEIRVDPGVDQYAVTQDGRRLLVIQPLASEEPIALIKNWRAVLQF